MKKQLSKTLAVAFAGICSVAMAQDMPTTNKLGSKYQFTILKDNQATSVKNQYHSGTCWCFSTQSFLESELMRMGKGQFALSQMFVIHNMFLLKAQHYMRYQGHSNFGDGGEPHDVINAVRMFGIVPASVYKGMPADMDKPEFTELTDVLHGMLDVMLKSADKEGHLNSNWFAAYQGALDGYMGKTPTEFTYEGKQYTPQSFAKYLGINADDYVEITSFTHHPFYSKFILEVADNFEESEVYNVPLDELQKITESAVNGGYTVEWGTDVSELGFNFKSSLALVPDAYMPDMTQAQRDSLFMNPCQEKTITQEMRQTAFDNLATTDDHGMQITGLAKDQNGHEYYIVKNSWGTDKNYCKGYFYVSVPYFEYKTTAILVNKNAIPADIRKKMGI